MALSNRLGAAGQPKQAVNVLGKQWLLFKRSWVAFPLRSPHRTGSFVLSNKIKLNKFKKRLIFKTSNCKEFFGVFLKILFFDVLFVFFASSLGICDWCIFCLSPNVFKKKRLIIGVYWIWRKLFGGEFTQCFASRCCCLPLTETSVYNISFHWSFSSDQSEEQRFLKRIKKWGQLSHFDGLWVPWAALVSMPQKA